MRFHQLRIAFTAKSRTVISLMGVRWIVYRGLARFLEDHKGGIVKAACYVCGAWILAFFAASHGLPSHELRAQEPIPRDTLVAAAREIIEAARYGALVTLDESGRPRVRAMDPFLPEEDMVIWLGTHRRSRKVGHIRNDPRVTLYYLAPGAAGYVSISGTARLVDDPVEKSRRWKDEWDQFYVDREADYVLIAVTPERLEVVDYSRGIVGDPETWEAPSVEFVPARLRP